MSLRRELVLESSSSDRADKIALATCPIHPQKLLHYRNGRGSLNPNLQDSLVGFKSCREPWVRSVCTGCNPKDYVTRGPHILDVAA